MSSLRNEVAAAEEDTSAADIPNVCRRKLPGKKKYLCPRRYTIAILLFLLILLKQWRTLNSEVRTITAVFFREKVHPSIGTWGFKELGKFFLMDLCIDFIAQVPSALLIFTYGSHKYLLASTVVISMLHMLLPVALNHHSYTLIFLTIAKAIIEGPIFIAVYSTLRHWAPPLERTRLVISSLSGVFFIYVVLLIRRAFESFTDKLYLSNESFYISGIAGLIWALLWYNIASDTPHNDPFISEKELQYLECNIPSDNQAGRRLKDIPWKSIVTSKPILILCIISVKMSFAEQTRGLYFMRQENLTFVVIFVMVTLAVLLSFPILTDFLIKKFRGQILLIRKCFLCGGFILNFCFILGSLFNTEISELLTIADIMYVASLPGFITLPLDLSPRYVSVIVGAMYTFYYCGFLLERLLLEYLDYSVTREAMYIIDAIVTVVCAALFAKWGDAEEQSWSLSSI